MSRVKEGGISEGVLLRLLRTVQRKAATSFPPPLCSLLEGTGDDTPASQGKQTEGTEDPFLDENTKRVTSVCISLHCCPYVIILFFAQILFSTSFPTFTAESENQNSTTSEENQREEDEEEEKVLNPPADDYSSSPYSCRWCKKGFAYKCRRLAHVKRCPMSQEYKCPQCPTKLPNLRALQRHKATAHCSAASVKKKTACDLCGRTFAHSSGENRLLLPVTFGCETRRIM